MGVFRIFWHEAFIPLRYALFPAILSISLGFLNWHNAIVFVIIKLLIFLRIVNNEDARIGRFKIGYVFLKLLVAVIVYFLTEWFATYLESMYLPPGVVPSSTLSSFQPQPEQPAKKTVRIRVSKSRAKYLTANSEADLTNLETVKVTLMRIFVEYMYFSSVIANYRWCFLGIIFIVYGILHAILLFCFSPTSKSGDDDDDDEDDEENLNDEDEIIDENIPDFRF